MPCRMRIRSRLYFVAERSEEQPSRRLQIRQGRGGERKTRRRRRRLGKEGDARL